MGKHARRSRVSWDRSAGRWRVMLAPLDSKPWPLTMPEGATLVDAVDFARRYEAMKGREADAVRADAERIAVIRHEKRAPLARIRDLFTRH